MLGGVVLLGIVFNYAWIVHRFLHATIRDDALLRGMLVNTILLVPAVSTSMTESSNPASSLTPSSSIFHRGNYFGTNRGSLWVGSLTSMSGAKARHADIQLPNAADNDDEAVGLWMVSHLYWFEWSRLQWNRYWNRVYLKRYTVRKNGLMPYACRWQHFALIN